MSIDSGHPNSQDPIPPIGLWLLKKIAEKKAQDPSYTSSSFAKQLNVSAGHLANLISGKRRLTGKSAKIIAERLSLSPMESQDLFRQAGGRRGIEVSVGLTENLISDEEFVLISDWCHFGILTLARTTNNSATPESIALHLGVSKQEASIGLDRLIRLGLLSVQDGTLNCLKQNVTTTNDIPSAAIRKHHRQVMERAERSIDSVPVELRQFESSTVAISKNRLPDLKAAVSEFHDRIKEMCECDSTKEVVYNLAVQLFPANITSTHRG